MELIQGSPISNGTNIPCVNSNRPLVKEKVKNIKLIINSMWIIIFIIIVLLTYLIIKKKLEEGFYPAWNNYVIYNELSTRLRIGIWKEWLNLNNLQFMDKLTSLTNCEIRLYDSNKKLLDDLLVNKKIDIAFLTEAEYGIYVISKLSNTLDAKNLTKETIIKNKNILEEKYNTRRLFTLYPIYRVFISNNYTISKPNDLTNKTIRITNLSNEFYKLDLELLKNYKYNQVFKGDDNERDRYLDARSLEGAVDGYFNIFNNPDSNLQFFSQYTNINLIDIYSDTTNSKISKFTNSKDVMNKYFFLKKDKMDLVYYPKIVHRRKQTFDYYNLPFNPRYLNCYSYKTVLISREDVNDEAIYLFTKKLYENIDKLKQHIPYFEFLKKDEMYKSVLDDILPVHRAVYEPK